MDRQFLEQAVEDAENIREMLRTDGWTTLRGWIEDSIASRTELLLTCDVERVNEVRAEVRALKSIILKVNEYLEMGKNAGREMDV